MGIYENETGISHKKFKELCYVVIIMTGVSMFQDIFDYKADKDNTMKRK